MKNITENRVFAIQCRQPQLFVPGFERNFRHRRPTTLHRATQSEQQAVLIWRRKRSGSRVRQAQPRFRISAVTGACAVIFVLVVD